MGTNQSDCVICTRNRSRPISVLDFQLRSAVDIMEIAGSGPERGQHGSEAETINDVIKPEMTSS